MYSIVSVPVLDDNYVWLIVKENKAIAIDVGDYYPVLDYLNKYNLCLVAILITHHHDDHIGGVKKLKEIFSDLKVYSHESHLLNIGVIPDIICDEGDCFNILGLDFLVWRSAGHTDTHLSYLVNINKKTNVFCGDTLFSAGCGRVFNSTTIELFKSIERFNTLPSQTLFYPAHEYTISNLNFALSICSDDIIGHIEKYKKSVQEKIENKQSSLPTSLENERLINVFLNTDDYKMVKNIKKNFPSLNLNEEDKLSIFCALRELKNNFK